MMRLYPGAEVIISWEPELPSSDDSNNNFSRGEQELR
jgi:hypothetical protein